MRFLPSLLSLCSFVLATSCAADSPTEDSTDQEIGLGSLENDANFPWVVRLSIGGQACHGTLLSPNWILTAAHCLVSSNPVTVSYKRTNPATGVTTSGSNVVDVKKIHPAYNNGTLENDIALVHIPQSLTYGHPADPLLQPAALPPGNAFVGQSGLVASDQNNSGTLPTGKTAVYRAPVTYAGQTKFFARSPTATICEGDSGSGFAVTYGGNQYFVGGIASALYGTASEVNCAPPQPNVETHFTNVRYYDSWIRSIVPNLPVPPVGSSDILWRCVPQAPATSCGAALSGSTALWNGGNAEATVFFEGAVPADWQIAGTGDFDGNGRRDILWRNSVSGDNVIWPNGTNAGFYITSVSPVWKVAGIGDFNGNGKSDILWRDNNGNNVIWTDTIAPGYWISAAATNWKVAGIGDFDGNGRSDILWRDTAGNNSIWPNGAGPGYWPAGLSTSWSVAGIGDFDGNGKSDILWRSTTGDNVIWPNATSPGTWITSLDTSWQVAGVGDFDSNSKADILWRRSNGDNAVWHDGSAVWTTYLVPLDLNWRTAGVGNFLP